jgi:hypothetical protein
MTLIFCFQISAQQDAPQQQHQQQQTSPTISSNDQHISISNKQAQRSAATRNINNRKHAALAMADKQHQ